MDQKKHEGVKSCSKQDIANSENSVHSFISPISNRSASLRMSPNRFETPDRSRRLSRICEGEMYSPSCAQHSTPRSSVKFRNLPDHGTPPSRLHNFVIRNPFERTLLKKLHLPLISPTLFMKVVSPSQGSEFSWTIDDLSQLHPAEIDELQTQYDDVFDSDTEREAQEQINRFFGSNPIVESPWGPLEALKRVNLTFHDTPVRSPKTPEQVLNMSVESFDFCSSVAILTRKEAWTQTELTLAAEVSSHLETTMGNYVAVLPEKVCGEGSSKSKSEKVNEDMLRRRRSISPLQSLWRLTSTSCSTNSGEDNQTEVTILTSQCSSMSVEPMLSSPVQSSLLSSTVSNTIQTPNTREGRRFFTPLRYTNSSPQIELSPIVKSPFTISVLRESMLASANMPSDSALSHTWSQTDVTLPLMLPEHVEAVLKPYHTFIQDQSEGDEVNLNSSLIRRRKLLFHEDMNIGSSPSIDNGYNSS